MSDNDAVQPILRTDVGSVLIGIERDVQAFVSRRNAYPTATVVNSVAPESTPATLGDLQAVEHRMTAMERAEAEARAALDARIAKLELQVANIGRFLELLNSK